MRASRFRATSEHAHLTASHLLEELLNRADTGEERHQIVPVLLTFLCDKYTDKSNSRENGCISGTQFIMAGMLRLRDLEAAHLPHLQSGSRG